MTPTTGNDTAITVLHIASGDLWAGAEVQLYTLVRTLHHIPDVTVKVALLNHGTLERKLHEEGIEVCVFDETSLSSIQILKRILLLIRKQRPNVIHTHRIKENILGSIAGYLAGRVPSMRTTHGAPEHPSSWWQLPKRIIRLLDRLTGKYIQRRIIAVSEELATCLRQSFPPAKIRIIENGIDIDLLYNHEVKSISTLNTRPNILRIGLAGRLVSVKRVDMFIKTARYMRDNYPDINANYYIFGDGPLRSELESLSRALNMDSIVHFKGHCDDIINRLQDLDILMMTSDHEGLPMVLLEAMALKVPIVAHATGGITVLLDNGSCGPLVRNHCPEGYAYEIHRLALSTSIPLELTDKAFERVRSHYSAERNARAYLSQYSEINRPS